MASEDTVRRGPSTSQEAGLHWTLGPCLALGIPAWRTVRIKFLLHMEVQGAQRVPVTMEAKRPIARHIIIKRPKVKDEERILKTAQEKKLPDGCQMGAGRRRMGEELRGLRVQIGSYRIAMGM